MAPRYTMQGSDALASARIGYGAPAGGASAVTGTGASATSGSAFKAPYRARGWGGGVSYGPPPPTETMNGTLGMPGALEQAWQQHGNQFFQPGAFQTWWGQNQDAFGVPTNAQQYYNANAGRAAPQIGNRADTAYNAWQRSMPDMMAPVSLDPYYKNAETRAQNSLSKQQAARGVYGSSVAAGQAGDVTASLNAERANREADFELARRADQRASLSGMSGAARAADLGDLGAAGSDLSWLTSIGDMGASADAGNLARLLGAGQLAGSVSADQLSHLTGGLIGAGSAQSATEGRERGKLDDLIRVFSLLTGGASGAYDQLLGTDADYLDAILSGKLAGANQNKTDADTRRQQPVDDIAALLDAIKSSKG